MGTINKGNQAILFRYRQEITSQGFNQHTHRLFPRGIYEGGTLLKEDNFNIYLTAFSCIVEDLDARVSVRMETLEAVPIPVTSSTPFIVGRYEWINAENNYMDFIAVANVDILDHDLIFGKCVYNGSILESFDYAKKSWSYNYYHQTLSYNPPFKVIPNEPYSNKVLVLEGGPYTIHGKQITISTPTESPVFNFPVSANGRSDVVYIDSNDSSVKILQGQNISGAPVPQTANQQFPVAIIRFPPGAPNVVQGSYIEYLHPDNYRSNTVQLDYPSVTTSTPDSYALRDTNADITANKFHSDVADGEAPLSVVSTTQVDNLNVEFVGGDSLEDIHKYVTARALVFG